MVYSRKLFYWGAFSLLAVATVAFCSVSAENTIRPSGIIIHHSAIPASTDSGSVDVTLIDKIHRARGYRTFYWGRFYDAGYHYIILPDGTVQQGRPEHCKGAHARGYNSYLGICWVGDFSSRDNPYGEEGLMQPTEAQMRSLVGLCRHLKRKYNIPLQSTDLTMM